MNLIHLAIPVFFLLIAVELVAARLLEKDVYRLSDSVSDLSCGILDQVVGVFLKTALFAGYVSVYDHLRIFSVSNQSAVAWVACFLGVDLFYYCSHRFSHEVNAGWATHIVHHQSEELNLAVALRQSAFGQIYTWVFYLPLALLGFPPLMFLTLNAVNTLYQFWVHTRLVGKLGPIEWVFNTPSHHRVHHARNPQYIDKNHAGTLIVWDRLFGTFAEEKEECVYGITTPLRSWNPLWANFHYWVELASKARQTRKLGDAFRMFTKEPGWQPDDLGGFVPAPAVDASTYRKYDNRPPGVLLAYVFVQFVGVNMGAVAFFFQSGAWPVSLKAVAGLALVVSLASLGGLLDRRAWAKHLEAARLLAGLTAAALLVGSSSYAVAGAAAAALSLAWLVRLRPLLRRAAPDVARAA
jgi:sterol desaturase/sphingolipid hydroxylase (fatty acid hydroxylase superfamily)